jgi:hypothetical protein
MKTIITHLFDKESDSSDSDTVFGVRLSLSTRRPKDRHRHCRLVYHLPAVGAPAPQGAKEHV